MMLTVLSVAYPFASVRPDTAGGAEHVLAMLDEALVRAGHLSVVVACEGSCPAGALVATPRVEGPLEDRARALAWERHRAAIARALARWPVSIVHMHGQDFDAYLPPEGPPVLVTLHVPRGWYSPGPLATARPRTWFHCVSTTQRRAWPADPRMLPEIENGVPVELFHNRGREKASFALALGRIAPEKGFHLAADAAALAGVPLLIAGQVYPYAEHVAYFREQIQSRLNERCRFIGRLGFEKKRSLLAFARCLVAPSQVPETSSLVAMEALASGTPVVAYPAGALADIVEHGRTGYLVHSVGEMAEAIRAADAIDPEACRQAARARFSAARTIERYFELYRRLAR
jgi:glycosyltransferase involved in cell wall biosynthesis